MGTLWMGQCFPAAGRSFRTFHTGGGSSATVLLPQPSPQPQLKVGRLL